MPPRRDGRTRQSSSQRPRPRWARPAHPKSARQPRDWIQISVTALPGLAAVIALIFTSLAIRATGSPSSRSPEQGQITDRYNAAITNLGSPSVDVRLGGIYALQRIMQDSPRDQPTVVAVLCAFVRDHAHAATARSAHPSASLPHRPLSQPANRHPSRPDGCRHPQHPPMTVPQPSWTSRARTLAARTFPARISPARSARPARTSPAREPRAARTSTRREPHRRGPRRRGPRRRIPRRREPRRRGPRQRGPHRRGPQPTRTSPARTSPSANLADANLTGADLSGAYLPSGANLTGADLSLRGPHPREPHRREPHRRGPHRREPHLREPHRREPHRANLTRADLTGADFTGADPHWR